MICSSSRFRHHPRAALITPPPSHVDCPPHRDVVGNREVSANPYRRQNSASRRRCRHGDVEVSAAFQPTPSPDHGQQLTCGTFPMRFSPCPEVRRAPGLRQITHHGVVTPISAPPGWRGRCLTLMAQRAHCITRGQPGAIPLCISIPRVTVPPPCKVMAGELHCASSLLNRHVKKVGAPRAGGHGAWHPAHRPRDGQRVIPWSHEGDFCHEMPGCCTRCLTSQAQAVDLES